MIDFGRDISREEAQARANREAPNTEGDILARIDDAIDDAEGFIEWHGSADSATWTADGSHQPDELDGDYYAYDRPPSHNLPLLEAMQGAEDGRSRVHLRGGARLYINIPRQHSRRLTLEELLDQVREPTRAALHAERMAGFAEAAGIGLQEWQRDLLQRLQPAMQTLAAAGATAVEAHGRLVEQLNPTVTGDDRRPRPRRSGRDAQTSPYPSPRRGR